MSVKPAQERKTTWSVVCPVHGTHVVEQRAQPKTCKQWVRISDRCTRRCGKPLTDQVPF